MQSNDNGARQSGRGKATIRSLKTTIRGQEKRQYGAQKKTDTGPGKATIRGPEKKTILGQAK